MVHELLEYGITNRSNRSYSTLIMPVRKKDGSYRLYINYHALNKIIVKDKFPILFVDKLLDELHSAKYLSKLDTKRDFTILTIHTRKEKG